MEGGLIPLLIAGFAFVSFWLCLYIFGLYTFGKRLANRFRLQCKPSVAAVLIAFFVLLIDVPFLALQWEAVPKLTLLFGIWLVHAQPLMIGYWTAFDLGRKDDEDRWKRNTESWVSNFEERPPGIMREFEDLD